jgi:hypothetical protein
MTKLQNHIIREARSTRYLSQKAKEVNHEEESTNHFTVLAAYLIHHHDFRDQLQH